MIKQIPATQIGTGLTEVFIRSPNRKLIVRELIFSNSSSSVRNVNLYDGDKSTGIINILRVTIPASSTIYLDNIYREVINKNLVAICLEGTEVIVSGKVEEY